MLTHTLLVWAVLTGAGWWYFHGNGFVVAASVGYLSHLVADALTVDGVPLLWPLVKRRICLLPSFLAIRTGGVAEYVVVIAVCALALRWWL
jgi:inner membrane protein